MPRACVGPAVEPALRCNGHIRHYSPGHFTSAFRIGSRAAKISSSHGGLRDGLDSGEAFAWIDRYLDKAIYGPSWLRRPEVADIVVKAIHHAEDNLNRFVLPAYVVRPNHVHLLITPRQPV